jgi:hypothetical protein
MEDTSSFKRMGGRRDWTPLKYAMLGLMGLTTIFMVLTLLTGRTPYQ